jgi:hypothetical protein
MVKLIVDEENFGPHSQHLAEPIHIALWTFVERAVQNPDDPELEWTEKGTNRASQFTSGWALDWEVIRKKPGRVFSLTSGTPLAVKLWDVRELRT